MFSDLRGFIEYLGHAGEVVNVKEALAVKYEIPAAIEQISSRDGRVALFNSAQGYPHITIVGNLFGKKSRLAEALGVKEGGLAETYLSRRHKLIEPSIMDNGPVKENIITGKIDILKVLPVLTHHARDVGPYFTSAVIVAKDPETGIRGMGIHRVLVREPYKLGIFLNSPPLSIFLAKAEKKGQPLEIAVVLGMEPVTFFSSIIWVPEGTDKFAIAGALLQRSIPLVKCESLDLEVPANAEFVLEGRVLPRERAPEGPFGESTGYYLTYNNPVAEIEVITHRNNPVYHALMPFTGEEEVLFDFAWKMENRSFFLNSIPGMKDLRLRYVGLVTVAQVEKKNDEDGKRIINELMMCGIPNKVIIAVDEDVDIYNDTDIWWALATRFQPDRDLIVKSDMPGLSIDPSTAQQEESSAGSSVVLVTKTAKIGLDATKPLSKPEKFERINVPPYVMKRVEAILRSSLSYRR